MDSRLTTLPTTAEKADGHLLEAIEGFLLSRRVGNCTERTLGTYRDNLHRFAHVDGVSLVCSPLVIQKYLTHLQAHMKPITAHQHFRVLRTFFTWCAETGLRSESPMRGVMMRVLKTLPRVPEDEDLRRLLAACTGTLEGRRNKALVAMLADGGLRISEALRLRTEDVNFATRTITVRGGKGQKDGMGFYANGDWKVRTLEELEAAIKEPMKVAPIRTVWIHGDPNLAYSSTRLYPTVSLPAICAPGT